MCAGVARVPSSPSQMSRFSLILTEAGPRGEGFSDLPQWLKTLALQEKSLGRLCACLLATAGYPLRVYLVEEDSLRSSPLPLTLL